MKLNPMNHAAVFVASTFCAISISLSQTVTNVTQSTTHGSIQDAIAAANTDDTIAINGVFDLSANISLNKRLVLDGGDATTTKIRGNNTLPSIGGGNYFIYLSGAGAGSTISNITFEKTDKTGPQNLIGLQTGNVTFDTCTFTGQYALGEPDVSRAFEFSGSATNFLITDCTFESLRQPGYINAGATGLIEDSYVNNTRGWVIDGAVVQFNGNSWGTNAVDIAILAGTPLGAPYDPLFLLAANNNDAVIQDQRIGVNLTVANLTKATAHTSIQSAINGADPGDVIQAGARTYSEGPISLNKAVTLLGPNAGLAGNDLARVAEARIENSKMTITAAATIDGFEIYQTDNTADAVLVQAAATVTNTVVRRYGVSTGTVARGITTAVGTAGYAFTGNLFTGDSSGGFFSGHKSWNSGLWLNGGSGTITGNTFENCRTAMNSDDFNAGITISGNTFSNSGTYLAFGGVSATTGQFTIAGNEFAVDFLNPTSLPSTLFNNSNVAATFRIDATGNTFGGVATTALSNNQKFALEARMYHRGRSGRSGVVDFVANQQVVMPGTTIASAIAAATTGNTVHVGPGTYSEELLLDKQLSILGANEGIAAGVSPGVRGTETIVNGGFIVSATGATIDGLTIQNGRTSGSFKVGVAVAASDVTVTNCIIENVAAPVQSDGLSTQPGNNDLTLANCTIRNNWRGVYLNPGSGHLFTGNLIDANNGVGVGIGSDGQSNLTLTNNVVSNHTVEGWGASAVGSGVVAQENNFVANGVSVAHYGGSPIDATKCYWGAANPDFGSTVAGTVPTSPWYADEARTILVTAANFQNTTIPAGGSVTETDLYIGATYTVLGSLTVTGELTLANGAVLEVINGSLTINGSTLSGTFTFFNSLGSVNFNDDVAITGSAEGLILVSDVHVADESTITVDGTLVIDGSVIDCQVEGGSYTIDVNSGASFTMARTVMIGGVLNLGADDSKVYNNRFEASPVNVAGGTTGAQVYHNLVDDLTGWLTDDGTDTVTEVDDWENIVDPALTQNRLALALDLDGLDSSSKDPDFGRTVDAQSNVYVQPGDEFFANVNVSELSDKIASIEMLLGYNSDLLETTGQVSGDDWEVITDFTDASTVIGKLDSALGLKLTTDPLDPDPLAGGTDADDPAVATIPLKALAASETLFFQRVKLPGDVFGAGDPTFTRERFATGGAAANPFSHLAPFTSNSASIFIDGTAPTITVSSVDATQVQVNEPAPVDVLDPSPASPPAFAFRNSNPLVVTFTAFDTGLAGLETATSDDPLELTVPAAAVQEDLALSATNGSTLLTGFTVTAAAKAAGVVTYTVTLAVPADATNGLYTVTADVRDRSGNWSGPTALGDFELANELLATVELEGFTGGDRVVTFVATGGAPMTWVKTVTFTGATGSVTLEDVPTGTTHVSAKTAWNLRGKVAAVFTPEGVGSADLTGADKLPGGDLNGDNVVNTLDYSILRFYWLTADPTADIDGSSAVNVDDYNLLRGNFYTAGDSQ